MKKLWKVSGCAVSSAVLTGCALFNPLASFDETAVVIGKSGEIRELVVESFSEASYSEAEFESFIYSQEESYNALEEDSVTIDRVRLKDGRLGWKPHMQMRMHIPDLMASYLKLRILMHGKQKIRCLKNFWRR